MSIHHSPHTVEVCNILDLPGSYRSDFEGSFRRQLEPLYGSQDEALHKIFQVQDRTASVIINDSDVVAGVLVHKNETTSEYGIVDGLEIKTLMLVDPQLNGGKGYGAALIHCAEVYAEGIDAASLFVTVSHDKPESVAFFEKHGFSHHLNLEDAYRVGNIETVFKKDATL